MYFTSWLELCWLHLGQTDEAVTFLTLIPGAATTVVIPDDCESAVASRPPHATTSDRHYLDTNHDVSAATWRSVGCTNTVGGWEGELGEVERKELTVAARRLGTLFCCFVT